LSSVAGGKSHAAILTSVELPERVFVLARMPTAGAGEDPMRLFGVPGPENRLITPVFSSIVKAATFLEAVQAMGRTVGFDYVFPASAAQFEADFSAYVALLDPGAEEFFSLVAPGASA
jgi:hypothetical protein